MKTIIVASEPIQFRELYDVLAKQGFHVVRSELTEELEKAVKTAQADVLVLDFDAVSIGNRYLRDLKRHCPDLSIIGISSRSFHPELQQAMSTHIYACLTKPVDPEELVYWMRSIYENSHALENDGRNR